MSVVVDWTALHEEWADGEGESAFCFRDARRSDEPGPLDWAGLYLDFVNVMLEANHVSEEEFIDLAGMPIATSGGWMLAPAGPVAIIECVGPAEVLRDWYGWVAHALTGRGWSGVITTVPEQFYAGGPRRPGVRRSGTALVLAFTTHRRPSRSGGDFNEVGWLTGRVDPDNLAGLAADWFEGIEGSDYLDSWKDPVPHGALIPLLSAQLTAARLYTSFSANRHRAPNHVRSANFESTFHFVVLTDDIRVAESEIHVGPVEEMSRLAARWATMCDYAFISSTRQSSPAAVLEDGGYFEHTRQAMLTRTLGQDHVHDACAWQLLTERQVAAARDLSNWSVTQVTPTRYIVQARDLTPWFLPDPDNPLRSRIDPQTRAQARADFGPLIPPA